MSTFWWIKLIIIYNNIKVPRLSFTREDVEMEARDKLPTRTRMVPFTMSLNDPNPDFKPRNYSTLLTVYVSALEAFFATMRYINRHLHLHFFTYCQFCIFCTYIFLNFCSHITAAVWRWMINKYINTYKYNISETLRDRDPLRLSQVIQWHWASVLT